jgi:B12-binding domain/radical SAM domain protein
VNPVGAAGRPDLTVVFAYRRTNTYGPHVVLGALEVLPPPGVVDVVFAIGVDELIGAVLAAAARSPTVLVAWSFYSPDFPRSTRELAAVRAATHDLTGVDVVHLAGGAHASADAEATLRAGWDAVAIGEGETTFAHVVAALIEQRPLSEVAGLGLPDGGGALVTTGPAVREELDHFPAFAHARGRYNAIELTRGCIYACAFCQTPFLFKARFRHRSIDNVAAHVEICRSVGRRDIRFVTPTSLSYGSQDESVDLAAIDALLGACRRAAGPEGRVFFGSFPSEVRPEHVTPEVLRVLKRHVANDNLVIGAQSGSDAVLAATNRGHDVASIERAVRVALAEGFRPNVDLLFGLPSEGEAEAAASVALAERLADLGARVHSHTFMPLPGTPLRSAPPGHVSATTAAALDRLAGRGRQYGQFRQQQRVAEQLVQFVRRRPPG